MLFFNTKVNLFKLVLIPILCCILIFSISSCDNKENNSNDISLVPLSGSEIFNLVNPSVVFIYGNDEKGKQFSGTGFFIDNKGTIMTNYHVIEGLISATAVDSNHNSYSISNVVGYDEHLDIAIINSTCYSSVPVSVDYSEPVQGEKVYAIGYPSLGNAGVDISQSNITEGIVSATNREIEGKRFIETTVNITHGNSGGPLINQYGKVIGITSGGIIGIDYMNLAVAISLSKEISNNVNKTLLELNRENKNYYVTFHIADLNSFYQEVRYNGYATKPSDPLDANFVFAGWYTSLDFSELYDFNKPITQNITIYAAWYSNPVVTACLYDNITQTYSVKYGNTLNNINNPTRHGYEFSGWYIDEEYTMEYQFDTVLTFSISIYAKWTPLTYTVTYNTMGGTTDYNWKTKTYEYASTIEKPTYTPIKAGYVFKYWASTTSGTAFDFSTSYVQNDFTLYAIYEIAMIKHTYDLTALLHDTIDGYTIIRNEYTYGSMPSVDTVLATQYGNSSSVLAVPYTTNPTKVNGNNDYFLFWYYLDENKQPVRFSTIASDESTSVTVLSAYKGSSLELYPMWLSTLPTISISFKDTKSDLVYGTITGYYNDSIDESLNPIQLKTGYTFKDWTYIDKNSNEHNFYFDNIASPLTNASIASELIDYNYFDENSVTIYANWVVKTYSIGYELDGGINNSNNVYSCTIEDSITIYEPSKCDEEIITYSNGLYEKEYKTYSFVGWYLENTFINKISSISNSDSDLILYAKWDCSSKKESTQIYKRNGNIIEFGSYPQSKVNDSTIIDALTSLAGTLPTESNNQSWISYGYYVGNNDYSCSVSNYIWYIDITYNKERYRGVYFIYNRPNSCYYNFEPYDTIQENNGYLINTLYWFKYEPIQWVVLNETEGNAMLLCNIAIDSQQFDCKPGNDVNSNNYANSTIRAWLNNDFYNNAFNKIEKEFIISTEVDNSAKTTYSINNSNVCANTVDNVYLLSYQDALLYCSDTADRNKTGSDYSKCQGYNDNYQSKYWWLRSPRNSWTQTVHSDGLGYDGLVATIVGVVPVINLKTTIDN